MKKIVLVGGCFDLIHYGHVSFLQKAKELGDYLLIALESDENVKRRKGDTRPIHNQEQRKIMLEALSFVDEVLILPTMTTDEDYKNLVKTLQPHIIAITEGDPYKTHKEKQAKQINAQVIEVPKIHTPSTSQLVKLLGLD